MAVSTRAPLDWPAIATGAALALLVTLVPVALVRVVHGNDLAGAESNLYVAAVLLGFAGAGAGGFLAARRQPDVALTQASLAGVLGFAGLFAFAVGNRLVRHHAGGASAFLVSLLLYGTVFVSLALIGGYVALRRSERA